MVFDGPETARRLRPQKMGEVGAPIRVRRVNPSLGATRFVLKDAPPPGAEPRLEPRITLTQRVYPGLGHAIHPDEIAHARGMPDAVWVQIPQSTIRIGVCGCGGCLGKMQRGHGMPVTPQARQSPRSALTTH